MHTNALADRILERQCGLYDRRPRSVSIHTRRAIIAGLTCCLIAGCSTVCEMVFPLPPLGLTKPEKVAAELVGSSNPAKASKGRQEWIEMHSEWPEPIKKAVLAGEVTEEMTRAQAIAAWGMPSSRHGVFGPGEHEYWLYRSTSPDTVLQWNRDRFFPPNYAGEYQDVGLRGEYGWPLRSR